MVVNGATKAKDMAHFDTLLASAAWKGRDVRYEYMATRNLVALQGPASASILSALLEPRDAARIASLNFMTGEQNVLVAGKACSVIRCGYTGEDGFEIGMAPADAVAVAGALLGDARCAPAALGPRDSLRLEAGLCLYGHDLDESVTPNEAALIWTLPKARREGARASFLGASVILPELAGKTWKRRRVGLAGMAAPAREGAVIYARPAGSTNADPGAARRVGVVTSGTFSPILKAPIAMGFVEPSLAGEGAEVCIEVRGKLLPAKITKMPFVPTKYYKK
jgi:aminomethyltransferase